MSKAIYFECSSGISGDMTVAALLDLGADADKLNEVLKTVPVTGFKTEVTRVKKSGIDCCDFNVILDAEHENHDHDMEYLYGHRYGHHHDHDHEHEHGHHEHHHEHDYEHHHHDEDYGHEHHHDHHHGHEHHHDHEHHHGHHHEHRGMKEILEILEKTQMSEGARSLAIRIFEIIAAAESKAHGCPVEEVHFHEVGAVDSIVDVISIAVCFDDLGISEAIIPELYEGRGSVRCQHGVLPVPVPAVLNIAEANGLRLHIMNTEGEFVTPTGAAFAAAVGKRDLPESFRVIRTGLGAGKRETELSGILRAMLIEY